MQRSLACELAIVEVERSPHLLPRGVRKGIKSSIELRNAVIRYDFLNVLGSEVCKGRDVEDLLAGATFETVKSDSEEYLQLLDESTIEIATVSMVLSFLSSVEEGHDSFGQ